MRSPFLKALSPLLVAVPLLLTQQAQQAVAQPGIIPIPGLKPAPPTEADSNSPIANRSRYQAEMLFEGGLGDRSLGEGVVILGRAAGTELSLDTIREQGLDVDAGLEIASAGGFTGVGEVTDESRTAKIARDKREAAIALLQRGEAQDYEVVELRALDKITGKLSRLEAIIDEDVRFGALEIRPKSCQKTPPTEPPEDAAFLEIREIRPNVPTKLAFTGWMFRSRPAISALEHPIYDVWVVGCKAL